LTGGKRAHISCFLRGEETPSGALAGGGNRETHSGENVDKKRKKQILRPAFGKGKKSARNFPLCKSEGYALRYDRGDEQMGESIKTAFRFWGKRGTARKKFRRREQSEAVWVAEGIGEFNRGKPRNSHSKGGGKQAADEKGGNSRYDLGGGR